MLDSEDSKRDNYDQLGRSSELDEDDLKQKGLSRTKNSIHLHSNKDEEASGESAEKKESDEKEFDNSGKLYHDMSDPDFKPAPVSTQHSPALYD